MDEQEKFNGFQVPIRRALAERILIAGTSREIVILNVLSGILVIMFLHIWYFIFVNLIFHGIAVILTKKDPLFYEVFLKSRKHKSFYWS